jgi:hypothetical protein
MDNHNCRAAPIAASIEGLTDARIGELYLSTKHIGHATNRELAFARAIELEVLATQSAKQGAQPSAWISVDERLPAVGQIVAVYSPPTAHDWPGSVNLQFDCIDENDDDASSWAGHNSHYEHWCCVAKTEGATGPSEKAPYTHWMAIPEVPSMKSKRAASTDGEARDAE